MVAIEDTIALETVHGVKQRFPKSLFARTARSTSVTARGSRGRVLLIDDSAVYQKSLTYLLKREGFEVVPAFDGQDAIEKFAREEFDLIVTDIEMPRMNGLEFMRNIRRWKSDAASIPMIAVTAGIGRKQCLAAGADDYFEKPVCYDRFHASLRRHLTAKA